MYRIVRLWNKLKSKLTRMAEEYVLVPKAKYEQLLPNGPPPAPSQVVSVTQPPMGLPASDGLAAAGEKISKKEAEKQLLQAGRAHDNEAYVSDSDAGDGNWRGGWQSL